VFLFLLAGGYYFRSFFFDIVMHRNLYQYTLQSDNLDDLQRFAPVIETQMRELPVLKDVSLNSHIKSHQATVDVDSQRATASGVKELATMTISFSLAPRVALADAIAQIHDMEIRLALPATITTSLAKAE
jgi:multidrug efflux pump subunit AcrB